MADRRFNTATSRLEHQAALLHTGGECRRLGVWNNANRVLIDSLHTVMSGNDFAVVGGKPAASYAGGQDSLLYYKQALDADGGTWPATADDVAAACDWTETSLADINGQPGIAFSTEGATQVDIRFAIYY